MTRIWVRAVLVFIFTFIFAIAATFNGVLTPEFKIPTLSLMLALVVLWLAIHYWRGWQWHPTMLDGVVLVWIAAFGISLLANLDVWRRIAMGLWYVSLYIGVWYVLHDVLANHAFPRDALVDALMVSGFVVILFGYLQTFNGLKVQMSAGAALDLPRPVSIIGNTNALACFLIVLIPFALSRVVIAPHWLARVVMSSYAVLALLLLFLTDSRGAWLGAGAAVVVWGVLLLAQRNLLSVENLRRFWRAQSLVRRAAVFASAVLVLAVTAGVAARFLASFSQSGRSADLRTWIYNTAFTMISEKPLTGSGLFTFGRGLQRLNSIPPNQPHSHAHDVFLLVGAELGIIGLVALAATLVLIVAAMRPNWHIASSREKSLLMGTFAAVVGFGVHHLTDTPAMMPAIALVGLLALVLAVAPLNPEPLQIRWRQFVQPVLLGSLWFVLLVSGFWSSRLYSQYVDVLQAGITSHDYKTAAEQLQPIVDADPSLAVYRLEQAYLWGMAAYTTSDANAAARGITTYQQFIELEPQNAIAWANLSALNWQINQHDRAIIDLEHALQFASADPQLTAILQHYRDGTFKISLGGSADPMTPDFDFGQSLPDFQFLRIGITRQFLPQLGYSS